MRFFRSASFRLVSIAASAEALGWLTDCLGYSPCARLLTLY